MKVELKDLYQLLIAECRYGYTRNNHLMPDGAYQHVREYLPLMLKENEEFALLTAKQLCEECIENQMITFSDGVDDEFGSRQNAFEFIERLLEFVHTIDEEVWVPYNFDLYIENKSLDNKPLYNIYEGDYSQLSDENKETGPQGNPFNKEKLSKNNVVDYLFIDVLDAYNGTYRKTRIDNYTNKYIFDSLKRVFYIRREQH